VVEPHSSRSYGGEAPKLSFANVNVCILWLNITIISGDTYLFNQEQVKNKYSLLQFVDIPYKLRTYRLSVNFFIFLTIYIFIVALFIPMSRWELRKMQALAFFLIPID